MAFVLVTSGVMLLQLVAGRFSPSSSLYVSALACVLGGLVLVRRIASPSRFVVAAALLGLVVVAVRWNPFLHVEGGQDQGVYVAMSAHFERTGGTGIIDAVRERLPAPERAEYDRLNNRHEVLRADLRGRDEGEHQPGIFIADLQRSAYVFQFYPLHPLWMALAAKALGDENRVYSLVFFSALGVLMLSLLAFELSGRAPLAALLAAILLAFNPLHAFLSRFPLAENMQVFFSASAWYYLLLYFKARERAESAPLYLALSAAAWAFLFFTHIAGFLYLPLILAAVLAGTAADSSAGAPKRLLWYGSAVIVAYFASVWYGLVFAFPYSSAVFMGVAGAQAGQFFASHWQVVGASALACLWTAGHYASRFGPELKRRWLDWRGERALAMVLLAVMLGTAGYALVKGYRLGFTDAYAIGADRLRSNDAGALHSFLAAERSQLEMLDRLSHSGVAGLTHTSLVALGLYVSPFVLLLALGGLAIHRRRGIGPYELFAALFLAQFVLIRIGVLTFTYYYYYGRYAGGELAPYCIVVAAVGLVRLFVAPGRLSKVVAGGLAGLALVWEIAALLPQYPGGEGHRLDSSLRPLAQRIGDRGVVLLAGGEYPGLRTALGYYYGKPIAVVDPARLQEAVREYSRHWSPVYVLSNLQGLTSLDHLGGIDMLRDSYAKGHVLDVLPMRSSTQELRYFLYEAARADRPPRAELPRLAEGDVIRFDRNGNAGGYLGRGWSAQEESMRWTEGKTASLLLPFAAASAPPTLRFEVTSFNCADAVVRVNGDVRAHWKFTPCGTYLRQALPLEARDVQGGTVTVSFEMPNAISPRELDSASRDTRQLGLSVRQVRVDRQSAADLVAVPGSGVPSRADEKTPQSLLEGIDFSRPQLPGFVRSIEGISEVEPLGRWTDGPVARIRFNAALPTKFKLRLMVTTVYGPNHGLPVKVRVGATEQQFSVAQVPQSVSLAFDSTTPSDTIELVIPQPTSPRSRGESRDDRKLGIRLKSLAID